MQQDTAARPSTVTEPDTGHTRTYGRYTVIPSLTADGAGFSIQTYPTHGVDRIAELSITTTDADAANLINRVIREGGNEGVDPEGVRQAIRDALAVEFNLILNRVGTVAKLRRIELRRLVDAFTTPAELAELDALAADINRTLGRTLTDTVPAGRHPQVARSRSGVEHKPLTAPMQQAINSHRYGVIYPGDGIGRATLRALARRGLGTLHFAGTRKLIVSLEMNKAGFSAVKAVA